MTGRVLVVGSVNADLVAAVPAHPRPGETVLGNTLRRFVGGKGANQAVAAVAAGAQVRLAACVGSDPEGRACLEALRESGVDTAAVRVVDGEPTGTALIAVDPQGENTIVVVPGANSALRADEAHLDLHGADVVLLQLEVPLETVEQTVRRAAAAGSRVVLNLAPFAVLPPDVLDLCDPVVANEQEAAALARPPRSLVVTLGARGARWLREGAAVEGARVEGAGLEVAADAVDVVDTTGAGDAFTGALAAALAHARGPDEALSLAVRAGTEAVTREGAQGRPLGPSFR